ncbi:MAG: bifunctional adenosylcobinamide kinase/adenosylcobinamide-phosphate guanylyltransferase [Sphingomonadaceae bacterium]
MGRLVLILGGVRSGKSAMAEKMARNAGGRITLVATAQALDDEMKQRIAAHRAARPAGWRTLEEPLDLGGAVEQAVADSDLVVVDCLTLWLSNHLCRIEAAESSGEWGDAVDRLGAVLERDLSRLVEAVRSAGATVVVVSNEVGLGLVPPNPIGRVYRDLLGLANSRLAAEADQVLLMVAGLPIDVKRLAWELE